jgi:S1-C subfamily serine protease
MEKGRPLKPAVRARSILFAAWMAGFGVPLSVADTVTLKDGTQLEGTVVIEMPSKVVLQQPGGNKIILRDDIDSITKTPRVEPPSAPAPVTVQSSPSSPRRAYVPTGAQEAAANAVVKVYTTVSQPDPAKPWARLPPREENGSGVVIDGERILTSAHFLFYASQIQIKANQADDKIPARVVAVAPLLDLALLQVDDESFYASHPPLHRSNVLPRSRDVVSTFGYPADSTNVTVIRASVTEVDFAGYSYPISGVRIRTNNEIGAGISGSPVMMGDSMIGMAVRHTNAMQSSFSFVMPNDEIDPFLKGAKEGGYPGKPVFAGDVQKLENPALREYLNLDPSVHGVVVGRTGGADANYPLRTWDVITKFGGVMIDDLGTIPFGDNGRVPFAYRLQAGDWPRGKVSVTVVRNGQEMGLSLPVEMSPPLLVPNRDGVYPSYFIIGPIAFAAATAEIYSLTARSPQLQSILAYRGSPLVTRRLDRPAFDGEELVYVPAPFFPHKLAKGYGDPTFCTVKAINGTPVRNLIHLVRLIRDSTDEFIVVEFVEKDSEIMVFPREAMIEATDGILSDNGVRSQGSADVMAVWNESAAK